MPAILKILLYLAAALGAGALVAPPIFWLGQWLAATGTSEWLAGFPFHRVLSRCLQVSLLVLLWPAVRWIGLRGPSQLNLRSNPHAVRDLCIGLAVALVPVVLLGGVYFVSGLSAWRGGAAWGDFGRILLTAGAVSVVEEAVFRGVFLGLCLWTLQRNAAVFWTTVAFTAVHFLKPAKSTLVPEAVRWTSGLTEMFDIGGGLPGWGLVAFGAASLFVAGWVLGVAAFETRSLWLPIGLHAGWVFGQQTSNLLLQPAGEFLPWAGANLVSGAVPTGLIPLAVLLGTAWLIHVYLRYAIRAPVPLGS